MKAIRYITILLLLVAGVLHIVLFIQEPLAARSAVVLVFGIIYLVIGILLFLKFKYSSLSGIIFPLAGVLVGLIAFDPKEGNMLISILGIADVLIIILCSILEWERRKEAKFRKNA
jgi:tellurite resistance protein TehA-like permease